MKSLLGLYSQLSLADQTAFLNSIGVIRLQVAKPATVDVSTFNERYQKRYGTSPKFTDPITTGAAHNPTVSVKIIVEWGIFEGEGKNQKEARKDAIQNATAHENCPLSL